ncbi:hypothetical protein HVTV-2_gp3 [Haloarcula virus HVTV-2]|uniref:Uncharacterized protein n=1 Tax=Haloarcula vallismortis tailed virus 1 TaxID=1262528 RepID=L7TK66_9CAUD|nr:hypothetical protein HVTV1_3 [Haloarcula vallismortis tailed virus 1]AGC34375.1 hypothetical protein HVTV1_3 [Haloarcula vallismortis tailed virus 1]UBF22810.1 hypothetical protein HVTV-2_gp3 [Haloarcula virus HVTV-2]
MAYTVNAGDTVEVECERDDGETKTLEVTVEYNTTQQDESEVMGTPKVKAHTSKSRCGMDVLMYEDGSMRVKPRYNSNGRGRDAVLKGMAMVEEADA